MLAHTFPHFTFQSSSDPDPDPDPVNRSARASAKIKHLELPFGTSALMCLFSFSYFPIFVFWEVDVLVVGGWGLANIKTETAARR